VQSRTVPVRLYLLPACAKVLRVCVCGVVSEIDGALERASFTYHAALKAMHHPSYTSPYVREQQVGLSSVLSLPSLSPSTAPPYVCVERERLLVVHTHLSLSLHTHLAAPSLGDGSFS